MSYLYAVLIFCLRFSLSFALLKTPHTILKNRPLQTANTGLASHIPRLELGIKGLFRSRIPASFYEYEISLDWKIPNPRKDFKFLSNLKNIASKVFSFIKQILATTSIIASSLLATSIKSSFALGSAMSISIVPASRKYSKLSSNQKLGTTPLFFLGNNIYK